MFHSTSRSWLLASGIGLLALLLDSATSTATPGFSRLYDFRCSTCHTAFPQLNEFGRAFWLNNYRIPGGEKRAKRAWERSQPLTLQFRGGGSQSGRGAEGSLEAIALLGGGLLTRQDSFYLHHHLFEPDGFEDAMEAWVQHSFPGRHHLNLRLGQYEHPLPFLQEKQLLAHRDYLIYTAAVGLNDFSFSYPTRGLLLTGGALGRGTRFTLSVNQPRRATQRQAPGPDYRSNARQAGGDLQHEVGEVTGLPGFSTQPKFGNTYLSFQHQFRRGRVGLFGYQGSTEIVGQSRRFQDHFHRVGLDFEVPFPQSRLYGLWLTGNHSNPAGRAEAGGISGGLVAYDYFLNPRQVLYTRYDRAQTWGPLSRGLRHQVLLGFSSSLLPTARWMLEYELRFGQPDGFYVGTRFAL